MKTHFFRQTIFLSLALAATFAASVYFGFSPMETAFVGLCAVSISVGIVAFREALPTALSTFSTGNLLAACRHAYDALMLIVLRRREALQRKPLIAPGAWRMASS